MKTHVLHCRVLATMVLNEVNNAGNDFDRAYSQWDIGSNNILIWLDNTVHSLQLAVPETELMLGGYERALAYLRAKWPTWFTSREPEQLELPFQHYWRCAHYPSALENFQSTRQTCEWDCHTQELKWYHNGVHPMPKSWGTPREQAHDF